MTQQPECRGILDKRRWNTCAAILCVQLSTDIKLSASEKVEGSEKVEYRESEGL